MDDEQRERKHIAQAIERARKAEEERQPVASGSGSSGGEESQQKSVADAPSGPIKLAINLVGKKDSPPADDDLASIVKTEADLVEPSASSAVPAAATSAPLLAAPAPMKINPLKKPNPLKSNAFKSGKSADKPESSVTDKKEPMSAVEALILEDQERKRRQESYARSR